MSTSSDEHAQEQFSGVILRTGEYNLRKSTIELTPEMKAQIEGLVIDEARSIAKTWSVQSSRRFAMYLSGLGSILGSSLAVIASISGYEAIAQLLLAPTAIGAISAGTLAYLLQKDVE